MKATGIYFDGVTASPQEVELNVNSDTNSLEISKDGEMIASLNLQFLHVLSFSTKHLMIEVSELTNSTLEIYDQAFVDYFEEITGSSGSFSYQRRALKLTNSQFLKYGSLLVVMVAAFYKWGFTLIALAIVQLTPTSFDELLGNRIIDVALKNEYVSYEKSGLVSKFLEKVSGNSEEDIKIFVVENDIENAFALPGGYVVIYTGLLNELQTPEELAALLSHEIAHVKKRHAIFSIAENSTLSLLGFAFFNQTMFQGTVEFLSVFQQLSFSRELEEEADVEGMNILKSWKVNPMGFISLFHTLKLNSVESNKYLSTHPALDERISNIRKLGKNQKYNAVSDETLQIFNQLKTESED